MVNSRDPSPMRGAPRPSRIHPLGFHRSRSTYRRQISFNDFLGPRPAWHLPDSPPPIANDSPPPVLSEPRVRSPRRGPLSPPLPPSIDGSLDPPAPEILESP